MTQRNDAFYYVENCRGGCSWIRLPPVFNPYQQSPTATFLSTDIETRSLISAYYVFLSCRKYTKGGRTLIPLLGIGIANRQINRQWSRTEGYIGLKNINLTKVIAGREIYTSAWLHIFWQKYVSSENTFILEHPSSTNPPPPYINKTCFFTVSYISACILYSQKRNSIDDYTSPISQKRHEPYIGRFGNSAMFSSGKGVFLSSMFSCSEEFRVRLSGAGERKESERKRDTEKKKIEKRRPTKVKEEGRRMEHEQDREKEALSHRRVVWVGHGSFSTSEWPIVT